MKYNLQLEKRYEKRLETIGVDPICLSDMESDDEWITEKEDPALPLDNSWLDMNECFASEVGESSKTSSRKKRGR